MKTSFDLSDFGGSGANLHLYNTPRAVKAYARAEGLSFGEAAILRSLEARLPSMDMLDIGVGAGRASAPFAPLARRYVGIDYAPAMVDICRQRFPAFEFQVGDAANLMHFGDASFDFVFFSFNGIDCISLDERRRAIAEIHRVLRPRGVFAFSTHNASFLGALDRRVWSLLLREPSNLARVMRRKIGLMHRRRAVRKLEGDRYVEIIESQFGFQVPIIYVAPEAQIETLADAGFADIRLISNMTGKELSDDDAMKSADPWIYYFCAKVASADQADGVSSSGS